MVKPEMFTLPGLATVTIKMRNGVAFEARCTVTTLAPGPVMFTLSLRSGSAPARLMVPVTPKRIPSEPGWALLALIASRNVQSLSQKPSS